MIEAIIWLLVIEVIGLAALPVSFAFFRFLPERGLSLAKPLGLLLVGFAVWWLGMAGLPFTALISWLIGGAVLLSLSGWLLLRKGRAMLIELGDFVSRHRWLIVGMEIIFILVYAYMVNMRSFMPEIRDQEKFGDYAFMNSMVLHDKLPPADPWMSGYTINYYYFSHFMMAMLTKMSGIVPQISFNLTIPLIAALTGLAAFGLVYNLIAAARGKVGGWAAASAGVVTVLLVCFVGNLDGVRQVWDSSRDGTFDYFSWWTPSRVIKDTRLIADGVGGFYTSTQETINEFPFFSFLLADMHPHVMSLPFMLLAVAIGFNLLRTPAGSDTLRLTKPSGVFTFLMMSVSVGALYFINTWDYPTFFGLIALALLVREIRIGREETLPRADYSSGNGWLEALRLAVLGGAIRLSAIGRFWGGTSRYVGLVVRLAVVSLAVYLPFHLTFVSLLGDRIVPEPIKSVPLLSSFARIFNVVSWDRTILWAYFLVFGIFMLPVLTFLGIKLWPYLRQPYAYLPEDAESTMDSGFLRLSVIVAGAGAIGFGASELLFLAGLPAILTTLIGLISAPVLAIGVAMLAMAILTYLRPSRPTLELNASLLVLILLMTALGWQLRFELFGPLVTVIVMTGLLLWFESKKLATNNSVADTFGLLLIFVPLVLNFLTEIFYLRDIFESRFNTIFKFYYQSWLLYALASGYAIWRVVDYLWRLREDEDYDLVTTRFVPDLRPPSLEMPMRSLRLAPANMTFSVDLEQEEQVETSGGGSSIGGREIINEPKPLGWRWLWAFGMVALILGGLVYTVLGPYEKSGHFAKRAGLNGETWLQDFYPADYTAIKWLRQQNAANPGFDGVILEASGGEWIDYSRVSVYSGMSTVMGWYYHEVQWRGGKKETLDDAAARLTAVDEIYRTTDIARARELIAKYNIKYVYVGGIETSATSARRYTDKGQPILLNYPPAALAKFAQFMRPIYSQNGVTIYGP